MFISLVHRLQDLQRSKPGSTISCRRLQTAPMGLIERLPELGKVLYVPMCPRGATTSALPRGLLVDMMQLAPLLQTRTLVAASTITVEGPREWIDCLDREGRRCARLHLLPDTDYLAWDRLLEQGRPMHGDGLSRGLRQPLPACARLLRFHTRRLAGLTVLGAEVCGPVSSLGRQLAGQIARSEAVPLQMASGD
ncbi:hypothetical protein PY254_06015 [Rhodanobacter sp. AS-Z3]|uniref:hypothetical protein n=1 Tax=Rhodanobacter sp. AS-Z3 TaxID=3031330 RepID=UPI00247A83A5|nr:hypothetical protein [Rhodanobacter sp. AS-Z3]WEN16220.1 hypothetical protein PY254_06015 [Rhodanobacter sp. AS-Z3]